MRKYKLSVAVASALTTLLTAPLVSAQSSEGISEIVITANKREQSLNEVGLAVTALSGDDLKMRRIANVGDLAVETPGLNFTPSPAATPVYTLRGVGFFESSLAAYPDVSLYIDQAPLPFPIMSSLTAFDLERVEVMKGPQGTLFGNNATGGAINFIAAKPTDEFSAGFDLSYGRFNTMEFGGYVSGPLTDNLKGRLAIKTVQADEWQKSFDVPGEEMGEQDNTAVRLILDWEPTEDLAFSLNVNGWQDKNDPVAPQKIANTPQNVAGDAGLGGVIPADLPILNYPNPELDNRVAGWTPGIPYVDNDLFQVTLRADYDINDNLTLTSITSFAEFDFDTGTEGGGTKLVDLDLAKDIGDIETFSQEFRLANDPNNRFRWMVGANIEASEVNQSTSLFYDDTTSTAVNGITVSQYDSYQEMDNLAGFFNMEYDLTDVVTLKLGIRETKAERDGIGSNHNDRDIPHRGLYSLTEFFNIVYGAVYGGVVPTVVGNESIILDTRVDGSGNPVNPNTYLTTGDPTSSLSEESTSWSFGVDVKATEDLLLYLNIMQGYKAGSFPHVSGAIYQAYETVTQESLLDYEIGFKSTMFDGMLQVNGAGFYYDYEDKQLRAKFIDPIFGALDLLENIPESEIKGAELDITAQPIDGLTLSASVTYLDATVTKYDGVSGSFVNDLGLREAIVSSYEGVSLPFAPEWSFNVRADYTFPVTSTMDGFVGVGAVGQSETIGILTVNPQDRERFEIKDYTLVNVNAGLRSTDDRWQVMVWGKNVTDEYYWHNTIQAYDSVVRYAAKPVEYGVTLSMNF